MPEGDTLWRVAARLKATLGTAELRSAESRQIDVEGLPGHCVQRVEARGKHLLIGFSNGMTVHSHLGMTGSWHLYAPGSTWRKPAHRAALVLGFGHCEVVCFSPKQLELLTERGLARHPWLSRLGPDLLDASTIVDDCLPRLRALADEAIGVALLHQGVMAGLGNVYKSELLFLCRVNPFLRVRDLHDTTLRGLIERGMKEIRANRITLARRTRHGNDGPRLWIYGREGRPCLVCGSVIERTRQGDLGRSTWWCPGCQGAGDAAG
jgi:endonuclease VIII